MENSIFKDHLLLLLLLFGLWESHETVDVFSLETSREYRVQTHAAAMRSTQEPGRVGGEQLCHKSNSRAHRTKLRLPKASMFLTPSCLFTY